jgi:GntR family transcriptional regulator, transcriptional repressor for pyruvate dehydrogenase complex
MPDKDRAFAIYPIQRVDVYESVLTQLDGLVSQMEPGERLPPERQLVEQLQVSRVSVREALRALESMGKIEIRPNAGSFVLHPNGNALVGHLTSQLPIDTTFLDYLVDVRAAVEDKVVSLIDPDADLSSVADVLDAYAREMEEEDVEPGSLDLRFEAALGRVAGNPLLSELQRAIHELWVVAWSKCGIAPGDRQLLHDQHVAIFRALEARDNSEARRLMGEHVDRLVTTNVPVVGGQGT